MLNNLYSLLSCFVLALAISPMVFWILRKMKAGQNILEYVDNHKSKQGTLSMGGLIFIFASILSVVFFQNDRMLANLTLIIFASYGLLGFLDDFLKIKLKHNEGLKPYQKIIGQVGIAIIIALFIYNFGMLGGNINIPYTNISINISWWIIPVVIVFFLAVTNSVNLTDGLDGLAGSVSLIIILTLGVLSYIKYTATLSSGVLETLSNEYLNLAIVCFGLSGAILVFLLFNCYPATIFMGDTGSLALGGFIASVTAFLQEYLLLIVIGVAYVITALSSILQVAYYKMTKKRIFLMAPFHHHLERLGLKESKIVGIYTIITLLICMSTIILYIIKM